MYDALNVERSVEDALKILVFEDGLALDTVRDLRWNDIRWDVNAVLLRKPCSRKCLIGLALNLPERGHGFHRHLSNSTLTALTSLRQRDVMRKIRLGLSWHPTEPVFTARDGQCLQSPHLEQWRDGLVSHTSGPQWGATPPFAASR